MKNTLYASFNYDSTTKRLAVFTGHALTPLKLARNAASPKDYTIYKSAVCDITIEDNNEDEFDRKINEFVISCMNEAAKYILDCGDSITELHHWSDVNLGYVGALFPSLYYPSNYVKKICEVFLVSGFENFKLKRIFVSGDKLVVDAAFELFGPSNNAAQSDALSSKYVLKSTEISLVKRFTRPLFESPQDIQSFSLKKESIVELPDLFITNTINLNALPQAMGFSHPPKCISRLLACCSMFSHLNTSTQQRYKIFPETPSSGI